MALITGANSGVGRKRSTGATQWCAPTLLRRTSVLEVTTKNPLVSSVLALVQRGWPTDCSTTTDRVPGDASRIDVLLLTPPLNRSPGLLGLSLRDVARVTKY